ncbi:MAG TPA: tRNA 2-thiouridine(34) synthase MnmA [Salinivirga sp.]|uniref:tRNA 2-thiouridine(34) synthase MnmA n=1 Tax=Salinivirga sp. TaxID=1970192 RepID=UPI002B464C27|nr:tRNA 2-thiouridine(34) synthase MnmA [Salinivirga sp.]HKK59303.1 tRNA 2-thiouridine(34) synthase MnmA [Salinivirga sp.]
MKKRVLLAMSGGIDSSVAGMLLSEQGYEIHGVTYRTYDSVKDSCISKETGCCTVDSMMEAKRLSEKLGYKHEILDLRDSFKETIIKNFVDEYLKGRTPNPCVVCNSDIKWGELIERANELNCDYIATGHYARIINEDGRFYLAKGIDENKDQTYFLYGLSQDDLKRTLFPLGGLKKDKIRKMAAERGFVKLSEKKESQEICFIPDNDYRRFLTDEVPEQIQEIGDGDFVLTNGEKVGTHKGYPFYTIGQRKGLGVALGYPAYVVDIDAGTNTVTLGTKDDLNGAGFVVGNVNLMKYDQIPAEGLEVNIKIRYRNQGTMGRIYPDGKNLKVDLYHNASAITPGQSAVFYENDDVVGGGLILSVRH